MVSFVDTFRKVTTMGSMATDKTPHRVRRRFTDEFKAGAVRLVIDEGKRVGQVARELDLTGSALRTEVERARADRGTGKPGTLTRAERPARSAASCRHPVRGSRTAPVFPGRSHTVARRSSTSRRPKAATSAFIAGSTKDPSAVKRM